MFIEKWQDVSGDLFIKYPLINNLLNDRGWRTTAEANAEYAKTVIGTAFALMPNPEEAKYSDGHPFKKTDTADIKEEIDYAYQYAIGQNIGITTESGQYKGASGEIPYFGIAKITDPDAKAELSKPDTKLIPKAVSAGIIHEEGPDKAISKYRIVHVPAVSDGAYGPKFVHIAKCNGDAPNCLPTLKAASSYKERNHICPLEVLSSYVQKSASSDIIMSAVNNSSTPGPMSFGSGTVETSNTNQQQQAPMKPTIRIRRYKAQGESEQENPNGTQQEQPEGNNGEQTDASLTSADAEMDNAFKSSPYYKELQNLKAQVGKQNEQWAYKEKRYALEKIIPPQLFTDNKGRFREKDWNNEIERAIKENVPIPFLQDYYQTKLQILQVPEIQTKRASSLKGASSQNYDEEDNERKMKLAELGKMIRGQR